MTTKGFTPDPGAHQPDPPEEDDFVPGPLDEEDEAAFADPATEDNDSQDVDDGDLEPPSPS